MKSVEDSFTLREQYLTKLSNIAKDVSDYASKLDEKLKQNVRGDREQGGKEEGGREMIMNGTGACSNLIEDSITAGDHK